MESGGERPGSSATGMPWVIAHSRCYARSPGGDRPCLVLRQESPTRSPRSWPLLLRRVCTSRFQSVANVLRKNLPLLRA